MDTLYMFLWGFFLYTLYLYLWFWNIASVSHLLRVSQHFLKYKIVCLGIMGINGFVMFSLMKHLLEILLFLVRVIIVSLKTKTIKYLYIFVP